MKNIFSSMKFSLKLFFESNFKLASASVLFFLILSLIPSITLYLQKNIFENLSYKDINIFVILKFFIILKIFDMLIIMINCINKIISVKLNFNMTVLFSKIIHKKLYSIEMINFDSPETANLLSRINTTLPSQSSNSVIMVLNILSYIIQIVTCSLILVSIHIILPFILILTSVPYLFLFKNLNFGNYFLKVGQSKEFRKNWYLLRMLFTKHFNKEIKFNHLFDYIGDMEYDINSKLHDDSYKLTKKYSMYRIILEIIKNYVKGICIIFVVFLIKNGANISALTVLIQSTDGIQNSLLNLFNSFKEIDSKTLYYKDYLVFLNMLEEEHTGNIVIQETKSQPFIELTNVNMKYPQAHREILNNINLKINKGEKIAIVGENGSGKTTLVNVLLGFYKIDNGEITVYNSSLKNCFKNLREKTVYVRQITNKYLFTIKDNIFLGYKEHKKINLFNKIFKIDDICNKFPEKENTVLGVATDKNYDISGGEWAKLGIIRNCIKDEPLLYIFDEPTASLDPVIESDIYTSFNEIIENKTSIFISHRLGITRIVDRIIVMQEGKIIEVGSHKELMKTEGVYYEMFMKQKELYIN